MFGRISTSKTAQLGALLTLAGIASMFVPQVEQILTGFQFPTGGNAVILGLGMTFGRDAIEKLIQAKS